MISKSSPPFFTFENVWLSQKYTDRLARKRDRRSNRLRVTEWTNQTHRERDAEAAEHVEYEKRVSEWLLGGYSITVPDTAIAPLLNSKLLVVDYDGAEIQITTVPRADGDLAVRHEDGTMLVGR